jgi:uncharacterized protein YkvS
MNVIELRSDLHSLIEWINDANILSAVKTLMLKQNVKKMTGGTPSVKKNVQKLNRDEVILHEDVMEKYKKWL